jgi:hypothetical protein
VVREQGLVLRNCLSLDMKPDAPLVFYSGGFGGSTQDSMFGN